MEPGQRIKTITSKSGKEIILRHPIMDDVDGMLAYINEISKEDTYITFSGEKISRDEEVRFLKNALERINEGNLIVISAYCDGLLIGVCHVERNMAGRKRTHHVGKVGISIRKAYRNDGIGKTMLQSLIGLARERLNLRILTLNVYEPNIRAHKLYQSLGFSEYGKLPGGILYRGEYVEEIEMYKPLR